MSLNVDTNAVPLIDTEKAFNSMNRKVMLHTLKFICPMIATSIITCYATPSRLSIVAVGEILCCNKGTTQGDPTAMRAYALGILQ